MLDFVDAELGQHDSACLESHRLRSLWDMLKLDAYKFMIVVRELQALESTVRGRKGLIESKVVTTNNVSINIVVKTLESLALTHSVKVAEKLLFDVKTVEEFHRGLDHLNTSLEIELQGRNFYGPLPQYAEYYDAPMLFGADVFSKFSSANNDIAEAGTCLALERGTACVLHLMRVVEVGLRALAATLGVNNQNDWGAYLREVDEKLAARIRSSGARTLDEQFFAEAAVTIDGVRRAWRNPTMHVENNYSPERAEDILISVRSLMRHLATKLSEPSPPSPSQSP